ncbi:polysaccharide biosynthesis PFTS motif protein [Thalassospira lucentensis]|uniref:polysaccharide biosynthesis PFTS motif protein n=1 Tax=Thalassospira lucentensis TaxID=168935 RepID=UPI003D2D3EC5
MFLKKRKFRRVLRLAKSYKDHVKSGDWDLSYKIVNDIVKNDDVVDTDVLQNLRKYGLDDVEDGRRFIKQVLLFRLSSMIYRAVISGHASGGSQSLAVPLVWENGLRRHGLNLSRFRSRLAWAKLNFVWSVQNLFMIYRLAVNQHAWRVVRGGYCYAHNFPINALPAKSSDNSGTLLEWVDTKISPASRGKYWVVSSVGAEDSSAEGGYQKVIGEYPCLDIREKLLFCLFGGYAYLRALCYLLLGRAQFNALFEEELKAIYFSCLMECKIGKEYVFTQSNYSLRPLWTHMVEKRGGAVTLVFYATNVRHFQLNQNADVADLPAFHVMTWRNILMPKSSSATWLRGVIKSADVKEFGNVAFCNRQDALSDVPAERCVLIFDVTPRSLTWSALLGIPPTYYQPSTVKSFVSDIIRICKRHGIKIAIKSKKKFSGYRSPSGLYQRFIEKSARDGDLIVVNDEVSAERHLARAIGAISIPFTSTAITAKNLGLPSVYYDPTRELISYGDDQTVYAELSHGIDVVRGCEDLDKWVITQLLNSDPVA